MCLKQEGLTQQQSSAGWSPPTAVTVTEFLTIPAELRTPEIVNSPEDLGFLSLRVECLEVIGRCSSIPE
jgi:hypothetical protein